MNRLGALALIAVVAGTFACTDKKAIQHVNSDDIKWLSASGDGRGPGRQACCFDPLSYAPDPAYPNQWPIKYIRVNGHFMNAADSSNNYNPPEGLDAFNNMLYPANQALSDNEKMHLPPGNNTPVLPIPFRYKLADAADVFYHYDDELYYYIHKGRFRNNSSTKVIKKYRSGGDSVINVFIMPHHPDSVRTPGYDVSRSGIALGVDMKLVGFWETEPWRLVKAFNHEIGHIFSLRHTWRMDDGCEDTPRNPNCWNYTDTPPCDSLVSNNIMDYNAWQSAYTPCQIGRMYSRMSRLGTRQRNLVIKDWCKLDTAMDVHVRDTVVWNGSRDIHGNIYVHEGGYLEIKCRVSMPEGSKIEIQQGGSLVLDRAYLHNDCGFLWSGIYKRGRKDHEANIFVRQPIKVADVEMAIPDLTEQKLVDQMP